MIDVIILDHRDTDLLPIDHQLVIFIKHVNAHLSFFINHAADLSLRAHLNLPNMSNDVSAAAVVMSFTLAVKA